MPRIVTANRLSDGWVVYLDPHGGWSERIDDAATADDDAALAPLTARAEAAVQAREIVDPYAIEVTVTDGRTRPIRQREAIRSLGPTVRLDLGYQARPE